MRARARNGSVQARVDRERERMMESAVLRKRREVRMARETNASECCRIGRSVAGEIRA